MVEFMKGFNSICGLENLGWLLGFFSLLTIVIVVLLLIGFGTEWCFHCFRKSILRSNHGQHTKR